MKIQRFLPLALLLLALAGFAHAASMGVPADLATDATFDATFDAIIQAEVPSADAAPEQDGEEPAEPEVALPWPDTFEDLPTVGPGQECLADCTIARRACYQTCIAPNGTVNQACINQCDIEYAQCVAQC